MATILINNQSVCYGDFWHLMLNWHCVCGYLLTAVGGKAKPHDRRWLTNSADKARGRCEV